MHHQYMAKLRLDSEELAKRKSFFEIDDADLQRLAALRGFAEKHMTQIIDDLYVLILGHPDSRVLFPDDNVVRHVKRAQRDYFLGLFSGKFDLAYVEDRLRIGVAHERVGVPPKWYIGAYSRYYRLICQQLNQELTDPRAAQEASTSLHKLIAFDMALAMDTYIAAQLDTVSRHQQAIRELSTPVIQLHERILLLPLIGTVDTWRAEQIMETVLVKVVEEQAKVLIMDIAGVAVVDTKVADHLLQTTEAVRLLGADTILSGVSPTVAKTVVRLGVDVSSMHTVSRLAEGIQLGMELVHPAQRRRTPQPRPRRRSQGRVPGAR